MSRIAIIVGHPKTGSFCHALGERYAEGARAAGHQVDLFVTGAMDFDPILREGFARAQPLEPDLRAAHDAVLAADHLVFLFPLWLGGLPAQMKGFLERVLQPDLIDSKQPGKEKYVKPLKGKSARIIVTMGMPAFFYRFIFRAHAVKMLKNNILWWMGVRPVRTTIFGGVEKAGDKGRKRWLAEVERMGRHAA